MGRSRFRRALPALVLLALGAGALVWRACEATTSSPVETEDPRPGDAPAQPRLRGAPLVGGAQAAGGRPRTTALRITVLSSAGTPVEGATVGPRSSWPQARPPRDVVATGGDGVADLELGAGWDGVEIKAAGYSSEIVWIGGLATRQSHIVILEPIRTMRVVVVASESERRVAGARVTLRPARFAESPYGSFEHEQDLHTASALSDANGVAELGWPQHARSALLDVTTTAPGPATCLRLVELVPEVTVRLEDVRTRGFTVLDVRGNAVPTAWARAVVEGRTWSHVRVDPDTGQGRLLLPGNVRSDRVVVEFSAPTFEMVRMSERELGPDAIIQLAAAQRVDVQVSSLPDGKPVTNAAVLLLEVGEALASAESLGRTDAAGRIAAHLAFGMPPGERDLWLIARADGYAIAGRMIGRPALAGGAQIELTLPPVRQGVVRVRTARGDPLAGASVWLGTRRREDASWTGNPAQLAGQPRRTDVAGELAVDWVGATDELEVIAWADGHAVGRATVAPGTAPWSADLRLQASLPAYVDMLTDDGQGIPRATAALMGAKGTVNGHLWKAVSPVRQIEALDATRLDLGAMPDGEIRVRFEAAGHIAREVLFEHGVPRGAAVRLRRLASLEGRVLVPAATPMDGLVAHALLTNAQQAVEKGEQPRSGFNLHVAVGQDGSFAFRDAIPGGRYEISVQGPGYSTTKEEAVAVVAPQKGIELRASNAQWTDVLVRVAGLAPGDYGNAMVTLDVRYPSGGGNSTWLQRTAIVGKAGTLKALLPRGRLWVQAAARGAFPHWTWFDAAPGTELAVVLQRQEMLDVRVVDDEGQPAREVILRLEGLPLITVDAAEPALTNLPQGLIHGRTNGEGHVQLALPPHGTDWRLIVDGGDRRSADVVFGRGRPERAIEIHLRGRAAR